MLPEASLSSSVEHHPTDRNSLKAGSPTEEGKQMLRASINPDNSTLVSILITFEMRPDWWRARTPNKLPNSAFRSSFWKTREDSETSEQSDHKGFEADRRKKKTLLTFFTVWKLCFSLILLNTLSKETSSKAVKTWQTKCHQYRHTESQTNPRVLFSLTTATAFNWEMCWQRPLLESTLITAQTAC